MDKIRSVDGCCNVVEWVFSGTYDEDQPILLDAADPSRFISRRSAEQLVEKLSGAFEASTTVCLHLPNDVLYPVIVLGIFASGCRWTGTNIAYTSHELEHHLRVSESRYVVTLPEQLEIVQAASNNLGWQVEIIIFTDLLEPAPVEAPARPTLHTLVRNNASRQLGSQIAEVLPEHVAVLQSTSGTTGLPKMAVRTHRSLILESQAIEDNHAGKPYEVRRLFCTPIFHAFSTPEILINPLRLGYTTYIMRRFDETFAQKIHDFQVTETAAPPPMLMKLHQKSETHHFLQSLRLVFSGGAPLTAELRSLFLSIFNVPPRLVQVWGMTEGGWFTTFKYPEDDTTGSVGRPIHGFEVKVDIRDSTRTVRQREAGELLVRSPQLMTGYFENENATNEAFTQGWLRTGDIGYIENGKVYIIDRVKDLIKVNGWQVGPTELEAALLESDAVIDAAAMSAGFGIDEHPLLFVVASHPDVKEKDVEVHLRQRVARYKVANVDVRFVESIPRNSSGKILRKVLRDMVTDD